MAVQKRSTPTTRYQTAKRPTIKNGYPQRIAMWDAVHRLGSLNRNELLQELRKSSYRRPGTGALDEAYCRIELTDMTKRGFLQRLD